MILYLDTSALVKLYAEETGTEEVRRAVGDAELVAVAEIGYVEARSALARKEREGAFSTKEHDEAVGQLERDFREVYQSRRLTGEIVARAGSFTRKHALRAYDAVHLATAMALREEAAEVSGAGEDEEYRVLVMTYDETLLAAARRKGLA